MEWYLKVLQNFLVFSGRARRKEYWMFILIPTLAVAVRRLHDTGRSGWWMLLNLLPGLGTLILLVFFVFESEEGTNEYGPNPKGA